MCPLADFTHTLDFREVHSSLHVVQVDAALLQRRTCIHRVVETQSVGPDSRIGLIQSLKYILVLSFQRRQVSRVISFLEVLLPNAFLGVFARWSSLLTLDVGFCPESPWST